LLARYRGVPNRKALPPVSEDLILAWADAYYRRTGDWPKQHSGPVLEEPTTTWERVDGALLVGLRGLPGNSSLARLLARQRGVRNLQDLPPLRVDQILSWADAQHGRTGQWPRKDSGDVAEAPGENWRLVDVALHHAYRGLPGGSSLARLLARHRGVRNPKGLPPLTVEQILAWADAHHRRTGQWPKVKSGPIPESRGETWNGVDKALSRGRRGFSGGSSLFQLLARQRDLGGGEK
jgi:hypothetical protein